MEGRRSLRRTSIGKCGILTTGIFLNNDYSVEFILKVYPKGRSFTDLDDEVSQCKCLKG